MAITRLAPSPTGALHLGNARTFLITYLLARQNGWRVLLRVEDLDGPRIKRGADRQAFEDLRWLGISWDEGPAYQSATPERYAAAARRLLEAGAAYPCVCTRSEVEQAASAPHASDGAAVYPGTCRGRFASMAEAERASGRAPCLRMAMPGRVYEFHDGFRGAVSVSGAALGDFPILKADGTPAYQLVCALDDAESGVTEVVRGDDLLDSTPRQMAIMEALGLGARVPRYTHVPLVLGEDGRRLAKRHGDTRLASYREAGVPASRVLGLLAAWCGIEAGGEPASADELVGRFDLARLPPGPVVMRAGALAS